MSLKKKLCLSPAFVALFLFGLGGSNVYAQSFEKMIESASVTLQPGMHAVQAAMNENRTGLVLVAMTNADQGRPICAGDRVFHSRYGSGRVVEVFTNGTAKVRFDSCSSYQFLGISDLGGGSSCSGGNGCPGN